MGRQPLRDGADQRFLSLSGGTWTKSAKTISVAGDAPVACPSGGCLMSDTGLYDPGMNFLRTITAAWVEHGDLGLDSSGNDYWATVQFGSPEPFSAQLVVEWVKTGQTKVIISTYPQSNTLISAKALKLRGWVAVNTTGSPSSNTSYLPTTTVFDQEIFVANVETGAFCRLAHHRALGKALNDKLGYFAQPQATLALRARAWCGTATGALVPQRAVPTGDLRRGTPGA